MRREKRCTIERVIADAKLDVVDARALLRYTLGVSDVYLLTHTEQALTFAENERFSAMVARRAASEPVAYIVGAREFYSLEFQVTPEVLIPRPETEMLVDFALEHVAAEDQSRILDLGTGSGCVAISIAAQRPRAQIVGVDRSEPALAVARENARSLLAKSPAPFKREGWDGGSVEARGNLCFVQSDWFSALANHRFDLILANPPYVAAADPHLTQGDLRYEPQSALVAGASGLECIAAIVDAAPEFLGAEGLLAFEHGYDHAPRCRALLERAGYRDIFSRRDLAGIVRISGGRAPALDATDRST